MSFNHRLEYRPALTALKKPAPLAVRLALKERPIKALGPAGDVTLQGEKPVTGSVSEK
jgi:hypothetical protein